MVGGEHVRSDMLAYDILHTEDESERSNSLFCFFFSPLPIEGLSIIQAAIVLRGVGGFSLGTWSLSCFSTFQCMGLQHWRLLGWE